MAFTYDEHLGTLSLLANAHGSSSSWSLILERISRAAGGWGAQIGGMAARNVAQDHAGLMPLTYLISNFEQEHVNEWIELGAFDPRRNPRARLQFRSPSPEILTDQDLATEAEAAANPLYRDFYPKVDAPFVASAHFGGTPSHRHLIFVTRSLNQGPIDMDGRDNLTRILPHLQDALDMRVWLDEKGVVLQSAALEASMVAALLLNETGAVISSTSAAEEILSKTRVVSCTHGRLTGRTASTNDAIKEAVARVTTRSAALQGARIHSRILLRGAGGERITARFAPISRDIDDLHSGAVAIVTLEPASEDHSTGIDPLASFNFTPAQRRLVLALVGGHTLNSYSEAAEISINTARNQLRQVFHKTGVSRQSDLIRAMSASNTKTNRNS